MPRIYVNEGDRIVGEGGWGGKHNDRIVVTPSEGQRETEIVRHETQIWGVHSLRVISAYGSPESERCDYTYTGVRMGIVARWREGNGRGELTLTGA